MIETGPTGAHTRRGRMVPARIRRSPAYRADEARTDWTGLCRSIARRGPGLRISATCWSAVTRSQSIPFTSHSAETPPHSRRLRRGEISSQLSSQAHARESRTLVSETAKTRDARSSNDPGSSWWRVFVAQSRGNALALQIEQRVCQVTATLAEQDRRA